MDAPERGALMLVRFVAAALMGVTMVEVGLYWIECFAGQKPMSALHCGLLTIPFIIGIVVLIKAKALAEWISDKLDD